MNSDTSYKGLRRTPFCILSFFILGSFTSAIPQDNEGEGGESDNSAISIESNTFLHSAQFMIEPGNITGKDDKKRTDVGIGETITLFLKGKEKFLKQNRDTIEWSITKGADLGKIKTAVAHPFEAELILHPYSVKERTEYPADIEVTVAVGSVTTKTSFCVHFPGEVCEAKHLNGGTPITDVVYASAVLEITLLPTSVSFAKLKIQEEDDGLIGPVIEPNIALNKADFLHHPNPQATQLNSKNKFPDIIANSGNQTPLTFTMLSFTWKCKLSIVTDNTKDFVFNVNQDF